MNALLRLEEVNAWYGKSHILRGVNLDIAPGETVALLGRNGAGKTTTLRAIMGLMNPMSGRISFASESLVGLTSHQITRNGLSLVPEHRGIFATLTVEENLKLALRSGSPWGLEDAVERFPALRDRWRTPGGKLSGGEQQMLAITRALMVGPKLLLLDEPTEGLAPVIVERVVEMIGTLKSEGLPILLVEQNLNVCRRVADRFMILDQGEIVWSGDKVALDGADQVIARHLTLEHA